MTTTKWEALRSAMAVRVRTVLPCPDKVPGNLSPPCALILPASPLVEFEQNFGDTDAWYGFNVRILVSTADQSGAQTLLDQYLAPAGAKSVRAALLADETLAGASYGLRVPSISGYGSYVYDPSTYLGAELSVRVYATQ